MFFDIFIDLCNKKGVSRTSAAKEIGLSNSITTKWKNTGATPSGETLDKVAAYFNVSTDYLLGKEEQKNPPSEIVLTERESRILEALRSKSPAEQAAFFTLLGISED